MSQTVKTLRDYLLETISFYEELPFDKIVLELDSEGMKANPTWTYESLKQELSFLLRAEQIIQTEKGYKRVLPGKSPIARLRRWLKHSIKWPSAK
jgi:hypothetical protein